MKARFFSFAALIIMVAVTLFTALKMNVSVKYERFNNNTFGILHPALAVFSPSNSVSLSESPIAEDPSVGTLPADNYDYTAPVPESTPVDSSYFDDCVFIGDSRMLGLIKYTDISPINYCSVGFSVAAYDTATFIKYNGKNLTVRDALRENTDYKAVYISTGLNELGWSPVKFTEKYSDMLDDIISVSDGKKVYIQLIMPITSEFENSKKLNPYGLKNSDVGIFNESLKHLAADKKVYILDCSGLFAGENGTLNPDDSSDGAHLTQAAYNRQLDYYKSHTVPD